MTEVEVKKAQESLQDRLAQVVELLQRQRVVEDLTHRQEGAHKHEIMRRHPSASGKVFRLGELENFDVTDPYRKSLEHFLESFRLIQHGVNLWAPRIQALAIS